MHRGFLCLAYLSFAIYSGAHSVHVADKWDPPFVDYARICPLLHCERCKSDRELQAPGVGFAMEMGYVTAAIRYQDQTYEMVNLVEGNDEYVALLRYLADNPRRGIERLTGFWDTMSYAFARVQRLLNKAIGRPANRQTNVLANPIAEIKAQIEDALGKGQRVTAATLSSPNQMHLTTEETSDILDYLGVTNLMAGNHGLDALYATHAAWAGYGYGLCGNYTDPNACEYEELRLASLRALHLDFAPENLSGTMKWSRSARERGVEGHFLATALGSSSPRRTSQEGEVIYWAAVRSRIRDLVKSFRIPIKQLILTGISAGDPRFQQEVKAALYDIVPINLLESLTTDEISEKTHQDLIFATAKGAAEFAKRRQEGPVNCQETLQCKQKRWAAAGKEVDRQSEL